MGKRRENYGGFGKDDFVVLFGDDGLSRSLAGLVFVKQLQDMLDFDRLL